MKPILHRALRHALGTASTYHGGAVPQTSPASSPSPSTEESADGGGAADVAPVGTIDLNPQHLHPEWRRQEDMQIRKQVGDGPARPGTPASCNCDAPRRLSNRHDVDCARVAEMAALDDLIARAAARLGPT